MATNIGSVENSQELGELERKVRVELNRSKIADLKKMLKERGLTVSGKKEELVDRLVPRVLEEQQAADSVDDAILEGGDDNVNVSDLGLDENALLEGADEDELNLTDEVANVLGDGNDSILADSTPATVSPSVPVTVSSSPHTKPNTATIKTTLPPDTDKESHPTETKKLKLDIPATDDEKKKNRANRFGGVVSPSSKEERAKRFGLETSSEKVGMLSKEDRAQKFGVADSGNAKLGVLSKEDRAKKFGLPLQDKNTPAATLTKTNDMKPRQLGVMSKDDRAKRFELTSSATVKLKSFTEEAKLKRAERFGSTISEDVQSRGLINTEVDTSADILKKRAERFGGSVGAAKWDASSSYTTMTEEEKRKRRAEKFAM